MAQPDLTKQAHLILTPKAWWRRTTLIFHLDSDSAEDIVDLWSKTKEFADGWHVDLAWDDCAFIQVRERRWFQRIKFEGTFSGPA